MPIFPLRLGKPPLVIYPVGIFRTVLCGVELVMAWKNIVKCWRVATYRTARLFDDWSAFAWALRAEVLASKDQELAPTVKAFNQVLYGKWAQSKRGWRASKVKGSPAPWSFWWNTDRETKELTAFRSVGGKIEQHYNAGEPADSCPILTAWIAGAARAWLWQLMCAADRNHVLYCDTDSVIVDEMGYDNILAAGYTVGNGLGHLRIVGVHERVDLVGIKHYVCDGVVTCAGVPARREWHETETKRVYGPEPLTVACANGGPPRSVDTKGRAAATRVYKHGIVRTDGMVTPHVLHGDD
jgi:hypothetical protein